MYEGNTTKHGNPLSLWPPAERHGDSACTCNWLKGETEPVCVTHLQLLSP